MAEQLHPRDAMMLGALTAEVQALRALIERQDTRIQRMDENVARLEAKFNRGWGVLAAVLVLAGLGGAGVNRIIDKIFM